MLTELDTNGFVVAPEVVSDSALVRLLKAATSTHAHVSRHGRTSSIYGIRGLLWSSPTLRSELVASRVDHLAASVLGRDVSPIDAVFFDKHQDARWSVPGHQDRSMPVADGSGVAKRRRGDIAYAEPSPDTLASLLAVRIHFDDADLSSGALQVVPRSHRRGLLDAQAIRAIPLADYQTCVVSRGDVLLMRPLLLHRSGSPTVPRQRRVLHVVYAPRELLGAHPWKRSA
jgi:hypothetical protein